MKESRVVVLSALSSAFATIFLVVGSYFVSLSLSAAFMASIAMMLVLSKRSYKGGILAYFSTIILTALFTGFFARLDALLPFALFTGLHPLVSVFLREKKVNKVIAVIIKDIWFVGALVITHLITKIYIGDNEFINKYVYPILIIGGALIFPVYDYMMNWFFKAIENIIKRLKL